MFCEWQLVISRIHMYRSYFLCVFCRLRNLNITRRHVSRIFSTISAPNKIKKQRELKRVRERREKTTHTNDICLSTIEVPTRNAVYYSNPSNVYVIYRVSSASAYIVSTKYTPNICSLTTDLIAQSSINISVCSNNVETSHEQTRLVNSR